LATQLEQQASAARLDEINSLPAITIIDAPSLPVRASYPKRRVAAAFVLLLALVVGISTAIALSLLRPLPAAASETLRDLQESTRRHLRRRVATPK
jgi:uncharacterized protein involved in exopolysaccharide biosynthesis